MSSRLGLWYGIAVAVMAALAVPHVGLASDDRFGDDWRSAHCSSQRHPFFAVADLDGDGRPERASITMKPRGKDLAVAYVLEQRNDKDRYVPAARYTQLTYLSPFPNEGWWGAWFVDLNADGVREAALCHYWYGANDPFVSVVVFMKVSGSWRRVLFVNDESHGALRLRASRVVVTHTSDWLVGACLSVYSTYYRLKWGRFVAVEENVTHHHKRVDCYRT